MRGVYTQPMRAIPATEACYVIGNESEKLTEVRLRVDAGLDESVSIPAVSDYLAVCRQGYGLAPEGLVF